MNYKDFNLGDWIGHISGAIEDERELDGNEMRDLVEFLSILKQKSCVDAISRQAVKEQMIKYGFHAPDMTVTEFVEDVLSVNPQEPFINKPCVSGGVCEHDKNKVLDKIRAEIEPTRKRFFEMNNIGWLSGCDYVLSVIDKYKAESEEQT